MRTALMALAVLAATATAQAASAPGPKVHTDAGWVQGVSDKTLDEFKGIPFAKPPVGDLRWRAPQKPQAWKGVRQAADYGASCMQPEPRSTAPLSEDCLYLNVWKPKTATPAHKLPVMVWIYGGGFRAGTASEPTYDGANFARQGVVMVTINYRLGKFGFMAHPDLTAESEHHSSGNYGLLDQIAALQWVQRNISAFGGDPKAVTIFGQSAGGHAVTFLVASPVPQGLVARAIGESAGGFAPASAKTYFGHTLRSLQQSEQSGLRLQADLKASSIADLRKLPAKAIQEAATLDDDDMGWVTQDGYILPDSVDHIFAAGRQNDVPVMMGFNSNEGASFAHERTLRAFHAVTAKEMGDRAAEYAKLYPATDDVSATRSSEMASRDNHFAWQTWTWARLQTATGKSPIYYYNFALRPPIPANDPAVEREPVDWGAHHSAEIPYVFGNFVPDTWRWRDQDRGLSRIMSAYWVNFAKTGNPNGKGLPSWKSYDPAQPSRMIFDEAPSQRPIADLDHLAFWDSLAKQ